MTPPTKYPQVPFIVSTTRHENGNGRVMWYHTLSDGRIVGYWEKLGGPPSKWEQVAPAIPDALLEGK